MLLGAAAGYFYWNFYGCDGSCMITSSPWRSMIYFSVMGALVNNMFKPGTDKKKTTDPAHPSE